MNNVSKGDIALLKMRTGDEYVAEIVEVSDTTIKVKRPLCMIPTNGGERGIMLQLVPMLFASPDQLYVEVYVDALLIKPVTAPEMTAKHYQEQVSGLQLVTGAEANTIVTSNK